MMPKSDETLEEIGRKLRGLDDDITQEPLPRRWVDLILFLEEKERKRSDCGQSGKPQQR
jgi:hypothetical protein